MDIKFLKTGSLGITNRVVNMIYGFGYLLLVVRGLPQSEYGILALTMSIVLVVEVLRVNWITTASLKFLPATHDTTHRAFLFSTNVFLFALLTFAVSILMLGLSGVLANIFKDSGLIILFRLVPIYYVCTFLKSLTEWILISEQRLKQLVSLTSIYTGTSLIMLAILSYLGMLTTAKQVIIVLSISGAIVSVVSLFFSYKYLANIGKVRLSVVKEMLSFGKYALGDNICGILLEKLDVIMLGLFMNPLSVAIYNAGKRMADSYETFLQGFWLVVYPTAAKQVSNRDQLRSTYRKTLTYIYAILIPVIVIAMLIARPVITFLLGKDYSGSVAIFRFFSINVISRVVLVFAGSIIIGGLNKIHLDFYTMLGLVIFNALLNLFLIPQWGIHGAAVSIIITTSLGAIIKNQIVTRLLKTNIFSILLGKHGRKIADS